MRNGGRKGKIFIDSFCFLSCTSKGGGVQKRYQFNDETQSDYLSQSTLCIILHNQGWKSVKGQQTMVELKVIIFINSQARVKEFKKRF